MDWAVPERHPKPSNTAPIITIVKIMRGFLNLFRFMPDIFMKQALIPDTNKRILLSVITIGNFGKL
jgi:hypothetical protein